MRAWWLGTIVAVAATHSVSAQSIAKRVDAVRDGTVELRFATRRGVCGDGRGSVWTTDHERDIGRTFTCIEGPVRVRLGRADGKTVSVRTCVACSSTRGWSDVDLGEMPALDAARYLLGVARTSGGRNVGDAVSAAAFADAEVTADILAIARDGSAPFAVRKQAMFWLGQSRDPKAIQFFRDILVR